jgi:hypothetical protein
MVAALLAVFVQGLSRSAAAAIALLVHSIGGIVVNTRFSPNNHLMLELQQHLIEQWHRCKDGTIGWPAKMGKMVSAADAYSPSPSHCETRAKMSGSDWCRPGSPITTAG